MPRVASCILIVLCLIAFAVPATANDYLVGGMFSTPPVTHFRAYQTGTVMMPVLPQSPCYGTAAPVAAYRPVAQPVVAYRPVAQPVVAYSPVVVQRPVVVARPAYVTAYSPFAQAPVVAQAPVFAQAPVVAPAPVVAGRPVWTRTKFYVPGQPIRNTFRVVLPGVPTGPAVLPY